MSKKKTIPAGEFKSKCLALLDEVAVTGRPIVVTKRGRPVAQIVPVEPVQPESLIGSVIIKKDIVSPIDVVWDADR